MTSTPGPGTWKSALCVRCDWSRSIVVNLDELYTIIIHLYVRLANLKSSIVAGKHDSAPWQLDLCACAVQHQSGRERVYVCVRKKGDRERDWESDRKRERERKGSQKGCYRRNGGGFADWPPPRTWERNVSWPDITEISGSSLAKPIALHLGKDGFILYSSPCSGLFLFGGRGGNKNWIYAKEDNDDDMPRHHRINVDCCGEGVDGGRSDLKYSRDFL